MGSRIVRAAHRAARDPRGGGRSGALAAALVALVALAGCGGSSSGKTSSGANESTSTQTAASGPLAPTQSKPSPQDLASILVDSPARLPNGRFDTQYTCRGKNISPAMTWSSVSPETAEVALLARTLTHGKIETNWVVAGIAPHRTHVNAGTIPAGAVVGRNSNGEDRYSVCPPEGKAALIVLAVIALPHKLGLKQGFGPLEVAGKLGTTGVAWGSINAAAGTSPGSAFQG